MSQESDKFDDEIDIEIILDDDPYSFARRKPTKHKKQPESEKQPEVAQESAPETAKETESAEIDLEASGATGEQENLEPQPQDTAEIKFQESENLTQDNGALENSATIDEPQTELVNEENLAQESTQTNAVEAKDEALEQPQEKISENLIQEPKEGTQELAQENLAQEPARDTASQNETISQNIDENLRENFKDYDDGLGKKNEGSQKKFESYLNSDNVAPNQPQEQSETELEFEKLISKFKNENKKSLQNQDSQSSQYGTQNSDESEFGHLNINFEGTNFGAREMLNKYLLELVTHGGSDLHIKSGKVVRGRFNGEIYKMGSDTLSYRDTINLAKELLRANFENLAVKKSIDFTYKLNNDYRFRANVFHQMEGISIVFRTIPTKIPEMKELFLPSVIQKICNVVNRGIILVTGPTGSGKTTTLASMINYMNKNKNRHIVTIEDPIEYVFIDDKSVINQRAIGQDVDNFSDALRASLREDPDVILVGEMRDLETVRTAMAAAETGHLVLATLHTLDAKETVGRVINMFPIDEQNRIKMTFSSVVEAIICQRFVRTIDNKRRVAVEVMIKNTRIKDMILDGREDEIYDAIEQSRNTYGMQTFEQHLLDLYNDGIIDKQEALDKSSRRNDLEIRIKNANLAKEKAKALVSQDNELEKEETEGIIALKEI